MSGLEFYKQFSTVSIMAHWGSHINLEGAVAPSQILKILLLPIVDKEKASCLQGSNKLQISPSHKQAHRHISRKYATSYLLAPHVSHLMLRCHPLLAILCLLAISCLASRHMSDARNWFADIATLHSFLETIFCKNLKNIPSMKRS